MPSATAAVAGPVSPPAIVVPFAPAAAAAAGRQHRFTPQDRAALIALNYALVGWTVIFEGDGQGMQWAALCPPDGDGSDARYLVGRDGSALVLLAASGQVLGRYTTGAALARDVKDREAAAPGGSSATEPTSAHDVAGQPGTAFCDRASSIGNSR